MHPVHVTVALVAVLTGRSLTFVTGGLIFCMGLSLILILAMLNRFLAPPPRK